VSDFLRTLIVNASNKDLHLSNTSTDFGPILNVLLTNTSTEDGLLQYNIIIYIIIKYILTLRWRVSEIGKNAIFALKRVQNMHILSGEESDYAKMCISTSFSSSLKE
jgi:hypothetical protein